MGGVNARLDSAARFVRQGAVFADIGTDHAYLPLFLLKEGRITHAFCTDVNEGPLKIAERNACAEGLSGSITFRLADGAEGLMDEGITDYAICGMGGELIASIIEAAGHLKSYGIRLIRQPMTKQAHLRRYLLSSGFSILAESYSYAEGKYYVTIISEYTGDEIEPDLIDAELGRTELQEGDRVAYIGYLEGKRRAFVKTLEGKRCAGLPIDSERELIDAIDSRISRFR
jgi:tRNA (adenine22-N1)-methyltransferase